MDLLRAIGVTLLIFTAILNSANGGTVSLLAKDAKTPITDLYLDFDKTITVDDFSVEVRELFCRGGKYPECNCSWLPGGKCNGTDSVSVNGMASQLSSLPGGGVANLTHSMGGAERLDKLRSWLERSRKLMDGNVFIMSTSWYPVTGAQWQAYLFAVSELLNLGFDKDDILTLADPGPGLPADKGAVIKRHMEERNVKPASAIFADDSGSNIRSAKGVCNTVHIDKRMGMDDTDRQYIEALAGGMGF